MEYHVVSFDDVTNFCILINQADFQFFLTF